MFVILPVSGCRNFSFLLWPKCVENRKATELSCRQTAWSPTAVKLSQSLQLHVTQTALQEMMLHVQSITKLGHVCYMHDPGICFSSSHELIVIIVVRDSCLLQCHIKTLYHQSVVCFNNIHNFKRKLNIWWGIRFSWRVWRWIFYAMLRLAVWNKLTDVSAVLTASSIRAHGATFEKNIIFN